MLMPQNAADVYSLGAVGLYMIGRDGKGKRRVLLNAHDIDVMVREMRYGKEAQIFLSLIPQMMASKAEERPRLSDVRKKLNDLPWP
jgi:hypothetical protein